MPVDLEISVKYSRANSKDSFSLQNKGNKIGADTHRLVISHVDLTTAERKGPRLSFMSISDWPSCHLSGTQTRDSA